MANEFKIRKGYKALASSEITGSHNISQDLTVGGSIYGTLIGTASYSETSSFVAYEDIDSKPTLVSSSVQLAADITGSFTTVSESLASRIDVFENATVISSSIQIAADISGSTTLLSESFADRITSNDTDISALQSFSQSVDTALSFDNTDVTVAGDIVVLGTGSFNYLQSVEGGIKKIGDEYIILNADTPTARYSGIRVYDSGSAQETGSLEYDSVENHWFYESTNEGYASILMAGPKGTRGALTVPTSGSIPVIAGNHMYTSDISNLNNIVEIDADTQITGSLKTTGNVGIGTSNPQTALQVDSSSDFSVALTKRASTTSALKFTLSDPTATDFTWKIEHDAVEDLSIYGYSSDNFRIWTNATERLTILSDGNVGIGTTSPSAKLHIHNGEAIIATSTDGLKLSYSVSNSSGIIDTAFSDNNLEFRTNGTAKMWIANGGNVGIGTTSPSATLHVKNSTGTAVELLRLESGYNSPSGNKSIVWTDATNVVGRISIDYSAPTSKMRFGSIYNSGYQTGDLMVIDGTGNVGIGTTAPADQLHVYSGTTNRVATFESSDSTAYILIKDNNTSTSIHGIGATGDDLRFYTAGSDAMRIDSNGNVGIGTTSPTSLLHVYGTGVTAGSPIATIQGVSGSANFYAATAALTLEGYDADLNLNITSSGNYANLTEIRFQVDGNTKQRLYSHRQTGTLYLENQTTGSMHFVNNGSTRMFISSSGNVGIGTTSPSAKLHVEGSSIIANSTAINPDSYTNKVVAGAIAQASSWGLTSAIGGNGGTGDSWAIGTNGSYLYMGYGDQANANSLQTFLQVLGRNVSLVPDSGNVGIGTTSPATKLDVNGNVKASSGLVVYGSDITGYSGHGLELRISGGRGSLLSYDRTASSYQPIELNGSSQYFKINGNDKVVIDSNGNVGINTTSPGYKLHVQGNMGATVYYDIDDPTYYANLAGTTYLNTLDINNVINHNSTSTRDKYRVWNGSTYVIGMQTGFTFGGLNNDYAMTFQMNDDSDRGFWWGDTTHGQSAGAMALTTDGRLTVARTARIGYGESDTTQPTTPLEVYGSGSTVLDIQGSLGQLFSVDDDLTGTLFAVSDISGVPILSVEDTGVVEIDGNLGIGTTTPSSTLDVRYENTINTTTPGLGTYGLHFGGQNSNDYATGITFSGGGATASNANAGIYVQGSGAYGTKMYFATTDSYAVGAKTRMTIQHDGNIGIGNTSPGAKLTVGSNASGNATGIEVAAGSGGGNILAIDGSNNHNWFPFTDGNNYYSANNHTFRGGTNNTPVYMVINSSGNVGIGSTSPTQKLDVAGTTNSDNFITDGTYIRSVAGKGYLNGNYSSVETASSTHPIYCISPSYAPAATTLGTMYGIGFAYASSATFITLSGASGWGMYVADNGNARIFLESSTGNIFGNNGYFTGDVTAYYSSDERLKENKKLIENASEKIKQIGGYEFDWIENKDIHINEGHDIGVIAQEVEKVIPEVVTTRDNGYKAVKYEKLVALLIQSNKELLERVEQLESKLK